jgi:exoribonuclease R
VARRIRLTPPDTREIAAAVEALREELHVELGFPPEVDAAAEAAARSPRVPALDATDVAFVTIDPPGSRDLDQALHVERRGDGYRVRYAIADVGAFVRPGDALDQEGHVRGQTLYAPDANARLYPEAVSEGAASLLPEQTRPALLWTMDADAAGEGTAVEVRRALVRSRAQLDYETVQRALDDGTAEEPLVLLRELGLLRQEREERIDGVDLRIPEQVVERDDGGYRLAFRASLPVERWNAQISLMTGQAAAELMLGARVGVLRTLPRADEEAVARLKRTASALGVDWPDGASFAAFIRALDPATPRHAAVLAESTVLLRGSGYEAFDGAPPPHPVHAGVGASYAHATAPLRRLVDRYVGEVCAAASADEEIAPEVREALPALPEAMQRSTNRAQQYEAGILSIVEAAVLAGSVGRVFPAVVVEADRDGEGGVVQLADPAVTARSLGKALPLGERLDVRLVEASVRDRRVRFEPA